MAKSLATANWEYILEFIDEITLLLSEENKYSTGAFASDYLYSVMGSRYL